MEGAKVYWTDKKGIHRADLDGKNVEDFVGIVPIMSAEPAGKLATTWAKIKLGK